jgi:hypothetical protein
MSRLERLFCLIECLKCLDSVEKRAFEARATAAVILGAHSWCRLPGHCGGGHWDELGHFAQVLCGCCKEELVFGSIWPSEAQAVKFKDAFEVGDLDLLRFCAGHLSHYATLASNARGLMRPRYEWRLRVL